MSIRGLSKTYDNGFTALKSIDLDIQRGEILALLGPNGAGKTSLIGIITGLVNATSGQILMDGLNLQQHQRQLRQKIGLVPQELLTESFETVLATVNFSRGLFGLPPNPALVEKLLKDLSLWDKRHQRILSLSGGMKRRVLIAKALVHEPTILFLDEPTAGVDVDLRHDLWRMVRRMAKEQQMTVILTTHYIEEAEDMADRIAVINHGEIILVQDKHQLMKQLGTRIIRLTLAQPLMHIPASLSCFDLELANGGRVLNLNQSPEEPLSAFLEAVTQADIIIQDIESISSSLEDIFVGLLHRATTSDNGSSTAQARIKE